MLSTAVVKIYKRLLEKNWALFLGRGAVEQPPHKFGFALEHFGLCNMFRLLTTIWAIPMAFREAMNTFKYIDREKTFQSFIYEAWRSTPKYQFRTLDYLFAKDMRRAPYLLWRGLNRRERRELYSIYPELMPPDLPRPPTTHEVLSAFGLERPRRRIYRWGTERPPRHYIWSRAMQLKKRKKKAKIKKVVVPKMGGSSQMTELEARKILEVEYVNGKPQFEKLIERYETLKAANENGSPYILEKIEGAFNVIRQRYSLVQLKLEQEEKKAEAAPSQEAIQAAKKLTISDILQKAFPGSQQFQEQEPEPEKGQGQHGNATTQSKEGKPSDDGSRK